MQQKPQQNTLKLSLFLEFSLHLDLRGAFRQLLGGLPEQAVFADQALGFLVIAQQAVGQFERF